MTQQIAEDGLRFPPVILFTDGREYWVGDGLHRILAARKAGLTEIAAEVRPGTQRDALLFGIGANSAHGLPRTRSDKWKAVGLLLVDPEWSHRPGDCPALPGGTRVGKPHAQGRICSVA